MAIFHCDFDLVKRSSGQSSVSSAAYRSAEKIVDRRTGVTHDYTRKKGVIHSEIIKPENANEWASDRHLLWNEVEASEIRKDSQLAREIKVALPKELTKDQWLTLLRNYINDQFTSIGMIADFVIHEPNRNGDKRNYHSHILLTMREITPEGFGKKVREWNAKVNIYKWRKEWENYTNRALEEAGYDSRIDCRSHAKKGLDKEPLLHLGPSATALERKGVQTDLGNINREIELRNATREKLQHERNKIEKFLQENTEKIIYLNVDIHSNKENSWVSPTQINYAKPYVFFNNPQQTITQIGEIQLLTSNTLNADTEKIINAVNTQNNMPLYQSNEQQEVIRHKKEMSFEEPQKDLNFQIQNTSDKKNQDRLRLEEKLDKLEFTRACNKERIRQLEKEDKQKNIYEIVDLKQKSNKDKLKHKKLVVKWNCLSVRDDSYEPRDKKSAAKIDKLKKVEMKKWSELANSAKQNNWSSDKLKKESEKLQKKLDLELENVFGQHLNRNRDRGLGI